MKKSILLILVIALTCCIVAGCGDNTATGPPTGGEPSEEAAGTTTRTVTDMVGREVEIPATVEKIVPLANTPRMITYLGLADKVVGISGMAADNITPVTAYAYANKDLWANLPVVGTDAAGATDYYPEEIIRVDPDIILCSYAADLADEIQTKTGIPVVSVPIGTLFGEDYEQALRFLADVCGVPERAEEVIAFINGCLDDLYTRTANVPDEDKPTVLGSAATFKGPHGIEGVYANHSLFKALNANDVTRESSDLVGGVLVDKEQIIGWNPDYIFFDFTGLELVKNDLKENPGFYAQLKAFQNGNLYQYPNATSYYSNVEIPLVNCYYIGSIIFPEQFEDITFEDKANEIFEFFLGDNDYLSKLEAFGASYSKVTFGES
ncbi:MAG: ABC transporter substrate-binding protein [Dethiobacteria bacterium]|jgi:iron complex transport system substrate-binding protein